MFHSNPHAQINVSQSLLKKKKSRNKKKKQYKNPKIAL